MSDAGISDLKDCVEHTFIDHLAGEWKGEELAGGCVNNQETWLKNPSFVMDVKENTDLDIIINQGGHSHAREAIGFALFKGEPPYLYNMAVNDTMWNQDTFTGKIEAGTYAVVPQTFSPGVEVPFRVTVIGEAHIEFKDMVGVAVEVATLQVGRSNKTETSLESKSSSSSSSSHVVSSSSSRSSSSTITTSRSATCY